MKKILTIIVLFTIMIGTAMGQGVPQAFKYQAVIRTPDGSVIADTPVELRITIKAAPGEVYQELHATTTNTFGLVNLDIGTGLVLFGNFSTIDWAGAAHYMTVEVSINGHPFVDMGTTQLLSVPYAFVAQKAVEGDADDDPGNELNTSANFDGATLNITDAGGTVSIDLSSLEESAEAAVAQATADAAQAAINTHVLSDEDLNATNEIELPDGGTDGQVLSTDGEGNYSWVDNGGSPCGLAIGDTYAGGIIFYLDGSGCHGLVAKATDEPGTYLWSTSYSSTYAYAAGIYGGAQNTKKIIYIMGAGNIPAAEQCEGLADGGFTDWYLPSKDELDMMFVNLHLNALGGFGANLYFSSTEFGSADAWGQDFADGFQGDISKYGSRHVRAVRAF